jgi:hypothetical protein
VKSWPVARPESLKGEFFVNKECRKKGNEKPPITRLLIFVVQKLAGFFGVRRGPRTKATAATVTGRTRSGLGRLISASFPFFLHSLFFYTPSDGRGVPPS